MPDVQESRRSFGKAHKSSWCVHLPESSALARTLALPASPWKTSAGFDELTVFEPKEFIESGENVTVLGHMEGISNETKQKFQSEWANVSKVVNGK